MIQGKIDELLAYCRTHEYCVRTISPYDGMTKIQISNKYLQKINLKIIDNTKIRLQNIESNRFTKEIEGVVQKLKVDMLAHHYDIIIYTNRFHYCGELSAPPNTEVMVLSDTASMGVQEELDAIVAALEPIDDYKEIKIYTSHKGIVSVMQESGHIKNRHPATPYESIYNLIKEKHLLVHFEWIRKTGRANCKTSAEQPIQLKVKQALVK